MPQQPAPIAESTSDAAAEADQVSRDFPSPSIPLSPPLSRNGLGRSKSTLPSVLDLPQVLNVTSGRVAIALALQHAGIGDGDDVLVPAYHCDSMVAPVRLVGARTLFYRVDQCARAEFADMEAKVTPKTRALILTHFFGFPQDLTRARRLCDDHGLILIEDCAHAFFGEWHGIAVGSVGDYAIASTMKFFPVFDGGILAAKTGSLSPIALRKPSLAFELKALSNVVERALHYKRLVAVAFVVHFVVKLKDIVWQLVKRRSRKLAEAQYTPGSSEGGYLLDPAWLDVRMSRVSRAILRHSDLNRIVEGRRENYRYLLDRLGDVHGIQPLYPRLPAGIVPLNFPVLVDRPADLFPALKMAGIPIWRFGEFLDEDIDDEVCANSCYLSHHVFQFPCHSELRPEELSWMVETILAHLARVMDADAPRGA